MSGASANAAARRRRGVTQTSNNYTTQSNQDKINIKSNTSNIPTLTVPQILRQLDTRIGQIEQRFSSSESMLDINGNIDVNLFPQKFTELEQNLSNVNNNISKLENNISENVINRLNGFSSTIASIESKLENVNVSKNEDSVSKEEFNKIMGNVGDDVGVLTDQVSDLKDLVLNIQSSTILLDKTIIELNNEIRSSKSNLIQQMEKEILKNEKLELGPINEDVDENVVSDTEENDGEEKDNEEDEEAATEEAATEEVENIELQIEEKDNVTQEKAKVEVTDELIQKLKMLNTVSTENPISKNNQDNEEINSEA